MSSNTAAVPGWVTAVRALSRAFGVVSAGLIVLSVLIVCQMVFVRSVLGESSIWQTEFVTFSIVAATFLGAPYILLTRGHVSVDVVPLLVAGNTRRAISLIGSAVSLAFCAVFLYGSLPWWHEAWAANQTTSSIWRARLWIPYLSVPVGLALLCLQFIAEMYVVATRRELPFGLGADERF